MVVLNTLGYALINWQKPAMGQVVLISLLIFAGYVVLWFYWKARNWARISVFLTSILCFLNLWSLLTGRIIVNVAGVFMIYAEAALAAFLVAWLYSDAANRFFSSPPNDHGSLRDSSDARSE